MIVPEVCRALIEALRNYVKMPSTANEWEVIAKQYEEMWNFPHCIGAMDGKHVVPQCPINSGSDYFDYKSFFSIVLFALVDADYNFLFVDVGCQGRISDGGVFKHSKLHKMMETGRLSLPADGPLEGRNRLMPYVIVGDEAFPLTTNIMKPYAGMHSKGSPERIFNYRLSRARRVVENVFGIASSVFRVLRKPILAVVYLHNFLRKSPLSRNLYSPPGTFDSDDTTGNFVPGTWRTTLNEQTTSLLSLRNLPRRSAENTKAVRHEFIFLLLDVYLGKTTTLKLNSFFTILTRVSVSTVGRLSSLSSKNIVWKANHFDTYTSWRPANEVIKIF
ncbi:uncharacterized protein LOC135129945 [Zophobas morio]|uniref:uncharacterized protein LOC135129945 n=1 Tax=Zophobas morio TaxID=2755281 RepID=UPI00308383C2